jgi:hypothetical protein
MNLNKFGFIPMKMTEAAYQHSMRLSASDAIIKNLTGDKGIGPEGGAVSKKKIHTTVQELRRAVIYALEGVPFKIVIENVIPDDVPVEETHPVAPPKISTQSSPERLQATTEMLKATVESFRRA